MFGTLRLLFACLVVGSHLAGSVYVAHFGTYAVRGFFVLSGFVITASLHEAYGFDAGRFWMNRLLRLLPPYYVVCLLTLLAVTFAKSQAAEYLRLWSADPKHQDVVLNLILLPLQFPELRFRLVPPTWSLAVELVMYFVLWAGIARREAYAALALVAGISYHVACLYDGFGWEVRYFPAPAALLSFSLGALLYFWRKSGRLEIGPAWILPTLAAWSVNLAAAGTVLPESYVYGQGFYVDVALVAVLLAGLSEWQPGARIRQLDRFLGDLAYPVFLVHWLVGFGVALAVSPGTWRGWGLIAAAAPAIFAAAAGLAWATRRYIEPLRVRVRQSDAAARPSPAVA